MTDLKKLDSYVPIYVAFRKNDDTGLFQGFGYTLITLYDTIFFIDC